MSDGFGNQYPPTVNRRSILRALRICRLLKAHPELSPVYAPVLRETIIQCAVTLRRRSEAFEKLRASVRSGRDNRDNCTVRAKQARDHRRLWRTRPHVCEECGIQLTPRMARVHHILQVQDGGGSDDSNLRLLCLNCNAREHVRDARPRRPARDDVQRLQRDLTYRVLVRG